METAYEDRPVVGMNLHPRRSVLVQMPAVKQRIIARRGKKAKNIAKVAAPRRLLTLVLYGMRDGQIRCLSKTLGGSLPARQAQAA